MKKRIIAFAAALSALLIVFTIAVTASAAADPLITLGYYNKTLKPALLTEATNAAIAKFKTDAVPGIKTELSTALTSQLNTQLNTLSVDLKSKLKAELKSELKAELTGEIKAAVVDEVMTEVNKLLAAMQTQVDSAAGFDLLHMTSGQTLMAKDTCEVILTVGKAAVIVTDPVNISNGIGLNDVTGACRLLNGENIPLDHYVMIPRGDGRGFRVTSGEVYLMIRGEYEIGK